MIAPLLGIYTLSVFALLMSELREQRLAQSIFKLLAGLCFIALAVWVGAFETLYTSLIVAALIASFIGDICLLKPGRGRAFLAGMLFFAAAHILYIFALAEWGFKPWWVWALLPSAAVGLFAFRMMRANIPDGLRLSTAIYCIIIALMGCFAALATWHSGHGIFAIAAGCFIISDIFVARHRFTPIEDQKFLAGLRNYLLITPLYFFAQALFALSAGLA